MSLSADRIDPGAADPPSLGAVHAIVVAALVLAAAYGGWALRAATGPEAARRRRRCRPSTSARCRSASRAAGAAGRLSRGRVRARRPHSHLRPGARAGGVRRCIGDADRRPDARPGAVARDRARPARTSAPRVACGHAAWRYQELELAGKRLLQMTVAPTTAGVITVACIGPAVSWVAAAGCANEPSRAALAGAVPLRPARDLAFLAGLAAVLDHLGDRRATLRKRLRGATTRRGQARLAARLGRAHARAGAHLVPLTQGLAGPRDVTRSLRAVSRSYGHLSVAAANGWPKRYRIARRSLRRDEASLTRAIGRVGAP